MRCPVCKGTGIMDLPHVPGTRGGWLDTTYNHAGMACGACGGTGVRPDRVTDTAPPPDPDDSDDGYADDGADGDTGGDAIPLFLDIFGDSGLGERDDTPPQPPSAESQLADTRTALAATLRLADHLPADVTGPWLADLPRLDVYAPETGRGILSDMRREFDLARIRHKPPRDIFSMSVTAEMGFDNEMRAIDRHLSFLEALMEHAERTLSEHPEFRRT